MRWNRSCPWPSGLCLCPLQGVVKPPSTCICPSTCFFNKGLLSTSWGQAGWASWACDLGRKSLTLLKLSKYILQLFHDTPNKEALLHSSRWACRGLVRPIPVPAQCWAGGDSRERASTVASTTFQPGETKQEPYMWLEGGRGSSAGPWILSGRAQHAPTGHVGGSGEARDGHSGGEKQHRNQLIQLEQHWLVQCPPGGQPTVVIE